MNDRAARYDGFKALRLATGDKLDDVMNVLSGLNFEQWNFDISDHIDLSLSPDQAEKLKDLGLTIKELHENLGKDIAEEGRPCDYKGKNETNGLPDLSWYDGYHSYEEHLEYLEDLQSAFPDNSEIFSAGTSLEGRDQQGIHLYGKDGKGKEAIIWHGTVHAREWITTATVEYLTYQLIAGYGNDENVTSWIDQYDFYIIPIINPDGFVWSKDQDRLWRKSRTPPLPGANTSYPCYGVDLNRNWPHEWDTNPGGSSNDSCTQTYRGDSPGSEPEMLGMANFTDSVAESQGLKLFIDWHSYSQLILSPYGYSCNATFETEAEHIDLMEQVGAAITDVYGTNYTTGPTCQTLYAVNGGSSDYALDVSGAEWSLVFELRDTGDYGFILPPDQILPNNEEVWEGTKVMLSLI